MDKIDIFLNYLYRSTFLPVHYYQDGQCFLALPEVDVAYDLAQIYYPQLLELGKEVAYIISDSFLSYGIIQNFENKICIIIGPVTSTPISEQMLSQIMIESAISVQYKEKVRYFFETMPCFTHQQFIHFLGMFHMLLNKKTIEPQKFFIDLQVTSLYNINHEYSLKAYSAKEDISLQHNTYNYELELYQCIEDGNIEKLNKLFSVNKYLQVGNIAPTSLRQEKNLFIAAITLYTRHAIAGGLDIETAYQLSDIYIMEAEKINTIEEVHQLSYNAIYDYTNRVRAVKMPKDISSIVWQCIQYISTHINTPVSIDNIADNIGMSSTHLSRKFKQEMGFNLSDFIMRKKLEESKSLLTFTDKPISEISEYLCFSSQPYFQNVFKKKYQMTPLEYRNSTKR